MAKTDFRAIRLTVWWTILIGGISTVVGLRANGYPSKGAILFFVGCAGLGLTMLALEYGWFKAPETIGMIPRAALVLATIWGAVFGVAYSVWPPDMYLFVKPGVEINPGTPNAFWVFFVILRGPEAFINVTVRTDDLLQQAERERELKEAKSDEERLRLAGLIPDGITTIGPFPELDPSPNGMDLEVQKFYIATGTNRRLKYKIYISHRKGWITEELEINTPADQRDWQFKMKVTDNESVVINCRDPRFPVSNDGEHNLPQCFPEFEGKLYREHEH